MKKFLTVFLLAIFSASAFAQEAVNKNQIKDFINEVGGQIISVAGEKGISEEKKKNKIITIIDESIDSDWISRFVLGKNYKNLNEENKTKFMALYRDFMINTYGPKFKNYNGRKFEVTEVVEQTGFFVAKAEFLPRD